MTVSERYRCVYCEQSRASFQPGLLVLERISLSGRVVSLIGWKTVENSETEEGMEKSQTGSIYHSLRSSGFSRAVPVLVLERNGLITAWDAGE